MVAVHVYCDHAATLPPALLLPLPQDSIKDWLDGLLTGKVRTAPLQQLPAFPAAGEGGAAAGGEAEADGEPVEEEFDLSDIMQASSCGSCRCWQCCCVGCCAEACWKAVQLRMPDVPAVPCVCAGGDCGRPVQGRCARRAVIADGQLGELWFSFIDQSGSVM